MLLSGRHSGAQCLFLSPQPSPGPQAATSSHLPPAVLAKADCGWISVVPIQRTTSGLTPSCTLSITLAASKALGRERRHLSSLKKLR